MHNTSKFVTPAAINMRGIYADIYLKNHEANRTIFCLLRWKISTIGFKEIPHSIHLKNWVGQFVLNAEVLKENTGTFSFTTKDNFPSSVESRSTITDNITRYKV